MRKAHLPASGESAPGKFSDPFTHLSAIQLAELIARGEASSSEVVEAHIARIEEVNPSINAVVVKRFDQARREANAADAQRARGEPLPPLHGVPITIKECFDLAGTPTTLGTPSRRRNVAAANDPYVQRLLDAGAIVLGKTNVPQALIYNESSNAVYGRTHNPWNLDRTCGGSSGGEAAIIAAGGSPLGLGSDVAGSLRLPAHFCGIASLKPTSPRMLDHCYMSLEPMRRLPIASVVGPLARDVDDLMLFMHLLGDMPNVRCEKPSPVQALAYVDVAHLRVAYFTDDGWFKPAPAIQRAVIEAIEMLRARGASCVEWTPPDIKAAFDIFASLIAHDAGATVKVITQGDRIEPPIALLMMLAGWSPRAIRAARRTAHLAGQQMLASELASICRADEDISRLSIARDHYVQQFEAAINTATGRPFDLIVCPVTSLPAWRHGSSALLLAGGAYCGLWNFLGYPAGVVPITRVRSDEQVGRSFSIDVVEATAWRTEQGSAGLPVGVQLVARPWQEHVALAAMKVIQVEARNRTDYPATPCSLRSGKGDE